MIGPDPKSETSGGLSARYGRSSEDANDLDLGGYVTSGFSKTLAAKLSVMYRNSDGCISDLVTGGWRPTTGNVLISADLSGNRMLRYMFKLGGSYGTDIGEGRFTASPNLFHSGKVYYNFLNSFVQKSCTLVLGETGWQPPGNSIPLSMFAYHLFSAKVPQQISLGRSALVSSTNAADRVGLGPKSGSCSWSGWWRRT